MFEPKTPLPHRLCENLCSKKLYMLSDDREVMLEDLELACSDLTIAYVDAGHWIPRSHPRELAALVTQHVRESAG